MTANEPSADAGTSSGVFDKPSPFASAPAPAPSTPTEAAKPAPYKPPTAVLGSAPIPGMASTQDDEPVTKPAAAPLGSAPIQARDSILDDDSIPPLPPIDIELTDSFPIPEDVPAEMLAELPEALPDEPEALPDEPEISDELDEPEIPDEPDFEATMVIAPDASLSSKPSGNSTEAFIERVKGQLSESPGQ
jgi:hypothetical protein